MNCLSCGKSEGLYKDLKENGKCQITCHLCGWKSDLIDHHEGLNNIKRIQETKKDWE